MGFASALAALAEGHCLNEDAGRAVPASPRENSFLMPKKHRISHSDFKLTANSRMRRERGEYFAVSHGPLSDSTSSNLQIACIVSKKTTARAVDRNLIKRRFRSVARNFLADPVRSTASNGGEIKKPKALIFYANKNAKTASFAEIKRDVEKLIRKSCDV